MVGYSIGAISLHTDIIAVRYFVHVVIIVQ